MCVLSPKTSGPQQQGKTYALLLPCASSTQALLLAGGEEHLSRCFASSLHGCWLAAMPAQCPRTGQEGQQRLRGSHLDSPLLLAMYTEQSIWLTNSCVLVTRSRMRKEE